jgi:hypothetical protein
MELYLHVGEWMFSSTYSYCRNLKGDSDPFHACAALHRRAEPQMSAREEKTWALEPVWTRWLTEKSDPAWNGAHHFGDPNLIILLTELQLSPRLFFTILRNVG